MVKEDEIDIEIISQELKTNLKQFISKLYPKAPQLKQNLDEVKFFDILVQAQPPEQPNTTIASPLTPGNDLKWGNGYAPSIPYIKDKEIKANIKDILMLAKAGMLVGDI